MIVKLQSTQKLFATVAICVLISTQALASTPIFMVEVNSEGARTGTDEDPTGKGWKETGEGQLTAMGMRQHYLVGYDIRANYASTLKLQNEYSPWQIYVRSTDQNATLQGGEA